MANEKEKIEVGARVGAIMSADEKEVQFFGYGTYKGDVVPPEGILAMGVPMKAPNPKIELDNGEVVWGCECWWGSEARVKESLGKRKIVDVKISEKRKEIQAAGVEKKNEPKPAQPGAEKHGEPGSKTVENKPEPAAEAKGS